MINNNFQLIGEITKIDNPSSKIFTENFNVPRKPVIITGALSQWKATSSLWNADYLAALFGHKQVDISVSQNGIFIGTPESGFDKLRRKIQFRDFINHLTSNQSELADNFYYLQQQSIPRVFPELMEDIVFPEYFPQKNYVEPTIWIGGVANISPLHYDAMDNLFVQISGNKRFRLFDPQQTSSLYPFPANSEIPHISQINIDNPDLGKFPNFTKAKYYECVLAPGEILFIPVFWWHQVYSIPAYNGNLNISVNFWTKPPLKEFLTPPGRRLAAQIPKMIKNRFFH